MFIRYNQAAKLWEYDTSVEQTGAGPWVKLPIDASQIVGGGGNIAYTNVSNVFTLPQKLQFANPELDLIDTSRPANAKVFRAVSIGGVLYIQAIDDAATVNQGSLTQTAEKVPVRSCS